MFIFTVTFSLLFIFFRVRSDWYKSTKFKVKHAEREPCKRKKPCSNRSFVPARLKKKEKKVSDCWHRLVRFKIQCKFFSFTSLSFLWRSWIIQKNKLTDWALCLMSPGAASQRAWPAPVEKYGCDLQASDAEITVVLKAAAVWGGGFRADPPMAGRNRGPLGWISAASQPKGQLWVWRGSRWWTHSSSYMMTGCMSSPLLLVHHAPTVGHLSPADRDGPSFLTVQDNRSAQNTVTDHRAELMGATSTLASFSEPYSSFLIYCQNNRNRCEY